MLASETQNADYLQGDDARWNHKEIERLRGYTMCIYTYMHVCMREMGDRARLCEPGFCDARDLVGGCECMKDASILVTSCCFNSKASLHKFLFRKRLRA